MSTVYQLEYPPQMLVSKIPPNTVFMFDIDETIVTYDEDSSVWRPLHPDMKNWLSQIIILGHPICFVTARLPPTDGTTETIVFEYLGMNNICKPCITKHTGIPLMTYTSGNLKGPWVRNIVTAYKSIGYSNFIFMDDRVTQLLDVQAYCPEVVGVWISSHSLEKNMINKYNPPANQESAFVSPLSPLSPTAPRLLL